MPEIEQAINGKSLADADLDDREEVIVALMEQGYRGTTVKGVVAATFVADDPFSENFRRALQSISQQRSSGRLNFHAGDAETRRKASLAVRSHDSKSAEASTQKTDLARAEAHPPDRAHTPTQDQGASAPVKVQRPPAQPQPPTPASKESSPVKLTDAERKKRRHCTKCGATLRKDTISDLCKPCRKQAAASPDVPTTRPPDPESAPPANSGPLQRPPKRPRAQPGCGERPDLRAHARPAVDLHVRAGKGRAAFPGAEERGLRCRN